MEYYQKWYVPSRGFEVKDMIADAAGVLLAFPLYQLWKKNPDNLLLNRKDLDEYLSANHLKEIIITLKTYF